MPVLITPEKSSYRQLAFRPIPSCREHRFSGITRPATLQSSWSFGAARCLAALITLFAPSMQAALSFPQQTRAANASGTAFDPLKQVISAFPESIKLNQSKRILEFCPDYEVCDGFVASPSIAIATLKDFAYLYIYFYSDYFDLPKWRNHPESEATVERVLSKPEYRNCKHDSYFESARCVLLDRSRKGAIRLELIRYDEGARNVVREDMVKKLTETTRPPKQ